MQSTGNDIYMYMYVHVQLCTYMFMHCLEGRAPGRALNASGCIALSLYRYAYMLYDVH